MKDLHSALLCVLLLVASSAAVAADRPTLPKTIPGKRLGSLLHTDRALKERSPTDRAATYLQLYRETGGFDLRRVEESSEHSITVLVETKKTEEWYRITCPVDLASAHGIVGVSFRLVPEPAELAKRGKLTDPQMASEIGRYVQKLAFEEMFSGVVLLAKNGEPVFEQAVPRRKADDPAYRNPTLETRFGLASINKTFTAVAVAQLNEAGRLDFQDRVTRFLPGFKPDQHITIHHLLTHTAGLEALLDEKSLNEMRRAGARTIPQAVEFFNKRPLLSSPGERFNYSNAGYILLNLVIQSVTGVPYEQYIKEHVFQPAGMTTTGDGMSNARDLTRFATALLDHKLLSPTLTRVLMTGKVGEADAEAKYAYGLEEETANGLRVVGHAGGGPNISAQLDMYPDSGHTLVVLSSQQGNTAARVANKVRELVAASTAVKPD
jgi:CubicO group peptidase (beta-lactamase class C family)